MLLSLVLINFALSQIEFTQYRCLHGIMYLSVCKKNNFKASAISQSIRQWIQFEKDNFFEFIISYIGFGVYADFPMLHNLLHNLFLNSSNVIRFPILNSILSSTIYEKESMAWAYPNPIFRMNNCVPSEKTEHELEYSI